MMERHWLTHPGTIRRLWVGFGAVLVLTVLAEAMVAREPHFAIETVFGFNAWYGFLACAGLIAVAKLLGWWLKRPDDYYEDGDG
jgi:hypothetical protein